MRERGKEKRRKSYKETCKAKENKKRQSGPKKKCRNKSKVNLRRHSVNINQQDRFATCLNKLVPMTYSDPKLMA